MMPPGVSVLMAAYNGRAFVEQAVESVLSQRLRDIELLVIDDGSTDGTGELLRRHADARLRLVSHAENRGQAARLNEGLRLARGRYVARLDQDDLCLPGRLQEQAALLDARPEVAAVGSRVVYADQAGRWRAVVGMRIEDFGTFLGALMSFATPVAHPSVMYRRDAVLGAGGYDESRAPCEDFALWCALALKRQSLAVQDRPLTVQRIHAGQQSAQRAARQREQFVNAHEAFLAQFVEPQRAAALAAWLRMDPAGWPAREGGAVTRALDALEDALACVQERFELDARERAGLRRRMAWWLARGGVVGLLHRRYDSARLFGWAVRQGPGVARWPIVWAFPLACALAPICRPSVRRAVMGAAAWARRRQEAAALIGQPDAGRREQSEMITSAV